MPKIKGSGKEILLRTLRKYGKEEEFLAALSDERRDHFANVTCIRWDELDMNERDSDLYVAANILFPEKVDKFQRLGYAMAKHGFAVFYKIFLAIPTLTFLFKKAAAQWSQMYDTGKASIENVTDHSAIFVLREFPDYPAYLRKYMTGFYQGMAEINGAKNPRVNPIGANPNEWKWKLEWD